MSCERREAYLDRTLELAEHASFERHLESCALCQRAVAEARELYSVAAAFARVELSGPVLEREAAQLMARAYSRPKPRAALWPVWSLGAAAMVALLLWWSRDAHTMHTTFRQAPQLARPQSVRSEPPRATTLQTDAETSRTLTLGGDRVVLSPHTRVQLQQGARGHHLLRLEHGTLRCEIAARPGDQSFELKTDRHTLRTTGARFVVLAEATRFSLEVEAGEVQLFDEVQRTLQPGERFVEEAPPKGAEHPKPVHRASESAAQDAATVDLTTLRSWVIEGRCVDAEPVLVRHVQRARQDAGAFSLLGDCLRKRGAFREAVAAYREAIAHGSPSQADRARFLAASVLQDELLDANEAVRLLESYDPHGPAAPEAKLRLARALVALGRRDDARRALEALLRSNAGAAVTSQAQSLLDELTK